MRRALAISAFLWLVIGLGYCARAEQPDIADLIAVHAELRALGGIPPHSWPLRDGVWDCEDKARWARAALEARGWPRERLGIYLGLDMWGRPHAVLCAAGATGTAGEPICLDRIWNAVTPLSAYGEGWREVDLP